MKKLLILTTFTAILLLSFSMISAEKIVISPSSDTYISQSAKNSNYENSKSLIVSGSPSSYALLNFNLGDVELPENAEIRSVKLYLYKSSGTTRPGTLGIFPLDAWDESTFTWKKFATTFGNRLDSFYIGNFGWLNFDITNYFNEVRSGEREDEGFLVKDLGWYQNTKSIFFSSEYKFANRRPYIKIEYEVE